MSEAEKEVLKTLKSGLGLTSAEREILVNYIDKLQKENKVLEIIHETYKEVVDKGEFISKDKIRKIIYPSPDNMIPLEVQTSDMYRKLNDLVKE